MRTLANDILRGAVNALKENLENDGEKETDFRRAAERHRRHKEACRGLVRLDVATWLGAGSLSSAERQRISRALKALEADGLAERVDEMGSGRTTHLKITKPPKK